MINSFLHLICWFFQVYKTGMHWQKMLEAPLISRESLQYKGYTTLSHWVLEKLRKLLRIFYYNLDSQLWYIEIWESRKSVIKRTNF
jgi:hypothetical protein